MFTPSKPTAADPFDITILSTPQPQATSTVQRKNTLESRYIYNDEKEERYKQSSLQRTDTTQKTIDTSLGILDNISSLLAEVGEMADTEKQNEYKAESERELARKLLQRCSDFKGTSILYDTNKENNANIQNTSSNTTLLSSIDQGHSMSSDQGSLQQESTLKASLNKGSTTSVVFEPNEITARSSGLSRNSEKSLSTTSNKTNLISFDTTTAEFMAQFNNEEFRPASEMASQMLADEASWQQNYSYALPVTAATEKEYLDLSCFSGIIGELDLSVESCAGRKMSVDEFFRRKCGNIGELTNNAIERPSLGLSVRSPQKKGGLVPLVDATVLAEASSIGSTVQKDKTQQIIPNVTKDIEEQSIMSLSSIAQALQDIDNGTPRRLVDQLIMAKKKRKTVQADGNTTRETYTVPSSRKSMPATPSSTTEKFEKDIGLINLSTKLSLDSKIINETIDVKHPISRVLSFDSNLSGKARETLLNSYKEHMLKKEVTNSSVASPQNQDLKSLLEDPKLSSSYDADTNVSPRHSSKLNSKVLKENKSLSFDNQETSRRITMKEENISQNSNSQIQLQPNRDVVIGRSTEELCNCIVGIARETDIELLNKSDRWVICSLSINQVQGDRQNVRLTLPKDVILIKPKAVQRAEVGVKVVKMSKPIIAVLNITISDMVTRLEWTMKHIVCFKPEELDVQIVNLSQKDELDFQCIVEDGMAVLPLTIENKNSTDVPIKLSILQDEPIIFSMDHSNELKHAVLKPHETFTMGIRCKAILPNNANGAQHKRPYDHRGRLIIRVADETDDNLIIREVPLVVQIGTCKIQIIDTDSPLIVLNKQTKPLTIVNSGSTSVSISASFVQESESTKADFSVQPESLLLRCEETGSFFVTYRSQNSDVCKKHAKIKLTVGSNSYYHSVIGEQNTLAEQENENFLRCETPQYLQSVSSPTSPHSVSSTRSGISGRNSPVTSVSGSTVAGDKIPIRATHTVLTWNSVKTGKSEIKEFAIRNTSNNKIKIQALIPDNDTNFRFLRERQAVGTTLILSLQRTESRTLSVVFSPHHVGVASGKIIFRHYESKREDNESRPSKVIFLYGYGGYGKVEISEAFKDISGKMWLSLGTLDSIGSLKAKIRLQNTGDLCSYAKIKLTPKAVYPSMVSSWHVNPTELLLNPKETQWVTLEFRPRKEDLALLRCSDVSHVGTITVIHGDEPTRWRIRRLYNKMKETGEFCGNENEVFRNIVYPICRAFAGEQLMPDLSFIRDSVQNLGELCRGVRQHEIMLTMEVCADETLSILHDNADDSQMFYSLCSDNSHLYEGGGGESFLPSETLSGQDSFPYEMEDEHFTVVPSMVVLNPPTKTEVIVTIRSSCRVAQPFETALSNTEYLSVVPAEGMIPTRRGFQLKIKCKQKIERSLNAILEIYTENNKYDVQIRVTTKRL